VRHSPIPVGINSSVPLLHGEVVVPQRGRHRPHRQRDPLAGGGGGRGGGRPLLEHHPARLEHVVHLCLREPLCPPLPRQRLLPPRPRGEEGVHLAARDLELQALRGGSEVRERHGAILVGIDSVVAVLNRHPVVP